MTPLARLRREPDDAVLAEEPFKSTPLVELVAAQLLAQLM